MSEENKKPENKDLTRKEEPTIAPTPDKLDRAARTPDKGPYPLTEEEATPSTPRSEQKVTAEIRNEENNKEETNDDYNRFVSHPRKR
jgi:hypothetical protein